MRAVFFRTVIIRVVLELLPRKILLEKCLKVNFQTPTFLLAYSVYILFQVINNPWTSSWKPFKLSRWTFCSKWIRKLQEETLLAGGCHGNHIEKGSGKGGTPTKCIISIQIGERECLERGKCMKLKSNVWSRKIENSWIKTVFFGFYGWTFAVSVLKQSEWVLKVMPKTWNFRYFWKNWIFERSPLDPDIRSMFNS